MVYKTGTRGPTDQSRWFVKDQASEGVAGIWAGESMTNHKRRRDCIPTIPSRTLDSNPAGRNPLAMAIEALALAEISSKSGNL